MKRIMTICAVVCMLAVAAPAGMTTIDFNALSGTMPSYTESGVTFTAVSGVGLRAQSCPNNTVGLIGSSYPHSEIRADIFGGTTFVSIDLGDRGGDSEILFLNIFDASDNLLGHTELDIPSSFTGMETLSLSNSNIAYAIFGSIGQSPNSVFADNFTFDTQSQAIPAPGAIIMGSIGVSIVGWIRRRKTA